MFSEKWFPIGTFLLILYPLPSVPNLFLFHPTFYFTPRTIRAMRVRRSVPAASCHQHDRLTRKWFSYAVRTRLHSARSDYHSWCGQGYTPRVEFSFYVTLRYAKFYDFVQYGQLSSQYHIQNEFEWESKFPEICRKYIWIFKIHPKSGYPLPVKTILFPVTSRYDLKIWPEHVKSHVMESR